MSHRSHLFDPAGSIRARLESDAWRRHPELARRLARRRPRWRALASGRRALRWQDRTLLILGIVMMALLLLRIETARAGEPWGLELQSGPERWISLALETRIRAEVTGLVARVEVSQRFRNDADGWAEGTYRFPLPDGAAVDRLRMQVGGRIIEGEIQERQQARRIYQQARASGQAASLVEQQHGNRYQSRLANIGPGEEIEIRIGFLVEVALADNEFVLNLPLTFTPRWFASATPGGAPEPAFAGAAAARHRPLHIEVALHGGLPLAAIESRYHDVDIQPEPDGYRIRLREGPYLPDRDFELRWAPELGSVPQPELLTWDGADATYALLMVVPPLASTLQARAREVIFIIDTSGSMEGESLRQAVTALNQGLLALDGGDTFNLIQFNSSTDVLFERPVPVSDAALRRAHDFLGGLRADGGTVMAPALRAALGMPASAGLLRQVVFITDGAVGNDEELLGLIGERLGPARLFTVGIGSAPNAPFMRKAAEIGRGSHTRIGAIAEVEARMTALWEKIRQPALADISMDWGADAEYYPEVIPDLYAGQPLWLVARLPLHPRDPRLRGRFEGVPWEHRVQPRLGAGTETLATIWAQRKLESLEDSLMFGADPGQVAAEATATALEYGLLSRYTGLVAVDRTPARRPDEALAAGDVPSLLPAGSTGFAAAFPATATGWLAQALLSLLALLVATGLLLFSGANLPALRRAAASTLEAGAEAQ